MGHLTDNASSSEYLKGNIANVQLYTKSLSAVEVLQNYEAQKSKFANTIVQQGLVLNLDAGNPYSYAGSGTTWYDVSGSSYNGSLNTGVVYNSDSSGSMVFDGVTVGQEVNIGSKTIAFTTGGTFEIWTKIDNVNRNQGFFSMNPGATYINFYSPGATNQKMRWEVIGNNANPFNAINSVTTLQNNTWYHVIGTFDITNSNTRIYINGVLDNSQSSYTNMPSSVTSQIIIGSYAGILDGNIAIAKIYNRSLSAAEVLQNYNAIKGRFGLL
jgi:hypothetical protein